MNNKIIKLKVGEKYPKNPFTGKEWPLPHWSNIFGKNILFNLPNNWKNIYPYYFYEEIIHSGLKICVTYIDGKFRKFGRRGGCGSTALVWIKDINNVIFERNTCNDSKSDEWKHGLIPRIFFNRSNGYEFLGVFKPYDGSEFEDIVTNEYFEKISSVYKRRNWSLIPFWNRKDDGDMRHYEYYEFTLKENK